MAIKQSFSVEFISSDWSIAMMEEAGEVVEQKLGLYRSLSLLNTLYNDSLATVMVPVVKTTMEIALVVCAYGTIRMYGKIPFQLYLILPVFGGFLFVEHQFAVDRMADVFDKSANIKYNYTNNYLKNIMEGSQGSGEDGVKHRKYVIRYLNSCRPLRCQLTHALFVENETRLVLLNMMLNMLVTLLLGDSDI